MATERAAPPARVRFDDGTAYELLASAVAVADPAWRPILSAGPSLAARGAAAGGRALLRRMSAVGRMGWTNLLGLVLDMPRPHSMSALLAALAAGDPAEIHLTAIGGRRRQLRELVPDAVLRAAVAGDRAAGRAVREATESPSTVLSLTRWLLSTATEEVHAELVNLLGTWRAACYPGDVEDAVAGRLRADVREQRRRLRTDGPDAAVERATGGLVFAPRSPPRSVVLAPAPAVLPIAIVVDHRSTTLIVYPPGRGDPDGVGQRLKDIGRALGDDVRIQILDTLRERPLTATELAGRLQAPRTTLLHHLALLRSTGLIRTSFGPGNATTYRLRPETFAELGTVAERFLRR